MECLHVCRRERAARARIYGEAICIEKSLALIAPFVCLATLVPLRASTSFACNSPCLRHWRAGREKIHLMGISADFAKTEKQNEKGEEKAKG